MMIRIVRNAMCILGLWATAVPAQVPASQAMTGGREGARPGYTNTRRVPAELLDGRRRQVVILPREPGESSEDPAQLSAGAMAKGTPDVHRLPEGYVIGARPARISQEDDWHVAHILPAEGLPDCPPLRLLPCQQLSMVKAVLADAREPVQFLLTGRVTEFQGVNYLLIEHVAQVLPAADRPVAPAPTAQSVPTEPTEAAAPTDEEATPAREPTAEEIVEQLLKSEPARAMVLPETQAAEKPSSAQPSTETPADQATESASAELPAVKDDAPGDWTEGTLLIDRLGRVVPSSEGWWMLAFEDRSQNASRKPVRLLPNRLLETALSLSGGGSRGMVFVISGEVTTYEGNSYLLLRKVLIRRDLGNLR